MDQAYDLEIRVVIVQRRGTFFAEALETDGVVSATTCDDAVGAYIAALYVAFEIGEPLFRKAPRHLLKLWKLEDGVAQANGIERLCLNVQAYREEPEAVLRE